MNENKIFFMKSNIANEKIRGYFVIIKMEKIGNIINGTQTYVFNKSYPHAFINKKLTTQKCKHMQIVTRFMNVILYVARLEPL